MGQIEAFSIVYGSMEGCHLQTPGTGVNRAKAARDAQLWRVR